MNTVAATTMSFEAFDPKTWLADRLRRTNWIAVGISAALQGGVLLMLIMMGVVQVPPETRRDKPMVTIIASTERQQPSAPAPPQPDQAENQVVQPQPAPSLPAPKIAISLAPPVAAAPERAPQPPAPAAAAPPAAAAAAAAPAAPAGGSGPVKVANLLANLTYGPPPPYPAVSRHKKEMGTVVLWVIISEDGRVVEVTVQRSSGFAALDDAALGAVRRYRFSPLVRDGQPVRTSGAIAMPFKLRTS